MLPRFFPRSLPQALTRALPRALARPLNLPPALRFWLPHATFGRAWALLDSFRYEQTDPDRFYGFLAEDTLNLITHLYRGAHPTHPTTHPTTHNTTHPLAGTRILDVGGGPGYFADSFARAEAHYVSVEPDVGEMAAAGIRVPNAIRGSGMDLPLRDNAFDITYSSNVAEHVPDPWRMGREMLRVTAPGGIVILSYTVWLGPFGGHETGLWPHYVGGEFAARRYRRRHGHEPKNRFGVSLFDVSAAAGIDFAHRLAAAGDAEILALFPRYHPWWAWWCVHIPLFREFAVSNLVIVLRKPNPSA